MKQPQKQKENKVDILDDMLSCIHYTPNRESDILAFMEQYQKADCDSRPAILEHLRSCMDGGDYPNPYASGYRYTAEDVSRVKKVLDEYTDSLTVAEGNTAAIAECVRETVCQLNDINQTTGGSLIDSWRRERLCNFINSAAELAGLVQNTDHTQQHRMW